MRNISNALKIIQPVDRIDESNCIQCGLNINNNSIQIQPEVFFDLININGKQVKMRIFQKGGFETTAQPGLMLSDMGNTTFTLKEYDEVDRIAFLIHGLYFMAQGDWNSELFDYCLKISCFDPPYNLPKELLKISIDPAKPFMVNGKLYICKRNNILRYKQNY